MAQSNQLIAALKQALKAHGRTYADVAHHLNLSEASVKRLFSRRSFTLQRLDQICQMLEIEISDLMQLLQERAAEQISGLSLDQEREIVADRELLLVTVCILNRWKPAEIVDCFGITELRCIRHLARLDRLQMIDLLPGNRVKLRIAPNFQWRENGPIQQFFLQQLQKDFFNSRFDGIHERLIVVNGMLNANSFKVFERKMERLAREFSELSSDDALLPLEERDGATVVLAIRPWRSAFFNQFTK